METKRQNSTASESPVDPFYLEASIPPGVTIDQYRRSRPARPTRRERLKELAGGARFAMPA